LTRNFEAAKFETANVKSTSPHKGWLAWQKPDSRFERGWFGAQELFCTG
jgi:hypothetical protein